MGRTIEHAEASYETLRLHGAVAAFSNDDVIHDIDTKEVSSINEALRSAYIGVRWFWVAGRMVVSENNCGSIIQYGTFEYFTRMRR